MRSKNNKNLKINSKNECFFPEREKTEIYKQKACFFLKVRGEGEKNVAFMLIIFILFFNIFNIYYIFFLKINPGWFF